MNILKKSFLSIFVLFLFIIAFGTLVPTNKASAIDLTASANSSAPIPTTVEAGVPVIFNGTIIKNDTSCPSPFNNRFVIYKTLVDGSHGISGSDTGNLDAQNPMSFSSVTGGCASSKSITSLPWTFPVGVSGNYAVKICADRDNTISETNEGNNCSGFIEMTVTPAQSSLKVSDYASWLGDGRDTIWRSNLSAGPITTYYTAPYSLTWPAVAGVINCTLDGSSVSVSGGTKNIYNANLNTQSHVFSCKVYMNSPALFSHTVIINTPPSPLTFTKTCNTTGDKVTLNWTLPSGYTGGYVRETAPFHVDVVSGLGVDVTVTPGQTYSGVYLMTRASNGAWSQGLTLPDFSCDPIDLTISAPTETTAYTNINSIFTSTITNMGGSFTGTFPNMLQIVPGANNGSAEYTAKHDAYKQHSLWMYHPVSSTTATLAKNATTTTTFTSNYNTFDHYITGDPIGPEPGIYSVRACVDTEYGNYKIGSNPTCYDCILPGSLSDIKESNEDNNCSAWKNITVATATYPTFSFPTASPGTTSAVLGGGVIAGDPAPILSRKICYGRVDPLQSTPTCVDVIPSTGIIATTVTGLTSGVEYYYFTKAENQLGEVRDITDSRFTTMSLELTKNSSKIKNLVKASSNLSIGAAYFNVKIKNIPTGKNCDFKNTSTGYVYKSYTPSTLPPALGDDVIVTNLPSGDNNTQITCNDSGISTSSISVVSAQSGTLTGSATCNISSGASSCTNFPITWNTVEPIGVSTTSIKRDNAGSPVTVIDSQNSGTAVAITVPYGLKTFRATNQVDGENNVGPVANEFATLSVNAQCVTGTVWNGTTCVPGTPTVELTASAPSTFTAVVGTPITFSSSVINASSSSTGASFYNSFQIATGASGTGTITTIASTPSPMPTLAALTSATASVTYTFAGSTGTRSVRLCADNNTSMVGSIAEINENNNCSGWVNGTVTSTVPAVSISVNPTSGTVNVVNPALTWSVTNNPTSCTASGDWSGPKASSGTNVSQGVLTQTKAYNYVLTCTNANGTGSSNAVVVVSAASPTATISANPSTVNQGQSTTLTWSSTSADYCTSNFFSGPGPIFSSLSVTPPSLPYTYTLSCINNTLGQFASDEAIVSVTIKKSPTFKEN
jgi:hypothetical protein